MLVLLDNGHGGLINGIYQTSGKQMDWQIHGKFYEGEFNRAIVTGIVEQLTSKHIPYVVITPEYRDVRLQTRVKRANNYFQAKSFFLSVHSNAGGGRGFEVYSSPGETLSDRIATVFGETFLNEFPERRLRTDFSDGDLDKEERFYVLTKTRMPAIITENFFMDNFDEFSTLLNTRSGRQRIVDFHVKAILNVGANVFNEQLT